MVKWPKSKTIVDQMHRYEKNRPHNKCFLGPTYSICAWIDES